MAQSRKYDSNAKRQAAYRKRRKQALDALITSKGLPKLPAVLTIPGWDRWLEAMTQIETLLLQIQSEMDTYYEERSERWQESDRGEFFHERMEQLIEITQDINIWMP